MKIVRTKSIRESVFFKKKHHLNDDLISISAQPHPHYAGKTVADPTLRPSTSLKTPAHLFIHVGGTHQGGHQGGKTYIPKPAKQRQKKRIIYTAPPMKGTVPARRGARAQHEIAHFQKTTDPLIPYLPFKRLVREVLQDILESMFEGSMVS